MKKLLAILLSVVVITTAQAQKERNTLLIGRAPSGFNKLNYVGPTCFESKIMFTQPENAPHNKHLKKQRKRKHTAVKVLGLAAVVLIPIMLISDAMSHPFGEAIMVK